MKFPDRPLCVNLCNNNKVLDYIFIFGKRKGHKRSYQYCNHLPLTDQVPKSLSRVLSTTGGYPTPQPIISMYFGRIGHQVLLSFVKRKEACLLLHQSCAKIKVLTMYRKKSFRIEYLDALNEERRFKLYFYFFRDPPLK